MWHDQDGDGVTDAKDRCPKLPGKAPTGCPDSDGDGLTDVQELLVHGTDPTNPDTDADGLGDVW